MHRCARFFSIVALPIQPLLCQMCGTWCVLMWTAVVRLSCVVLPSRVGILNRAGPHIQTNLRDIGSPSGSTQYILWKTSILILVNVRRVETDRPRDVQ
jgi:hypothetical protein